MKIAVKKKAAKKLASDTIYVVMSQAWEYNDEYYYTPEDKAGGTVRAYRDRAKAEADALDRNIEELLEHGKAHGLGEWNNCGEDISAEAGALLDRLGFGKEDDRELKFPEEVEDENGVTRPFVISPDDAEKLLDALGVHWYYVEEVTLGEA